MNDYKIYSKVYFTWAELLPVAINVFLLYVLVIKSIDIVNYLALFLIINVMAYTLVSYWMFYFILQKDYLIVRNSWMVWKEVKYPIKEVIKIEKHIGGKSGLNLQVYIVKRVKRVYCCNRESDIDKLIEDFYSIKNLKA